MEKLTENAIETFAIKLLERLGYRYAHGPDIAPDGPTPLRSAYSDPLLLPLLQEAVTRINPTVPEAARQEAISQVRRIVSPDLLAGNEAFHRMLTEGVKVSYQKDGGERGDLVWLADFAHPEHNDFLAVNQFTVIEGRHNKRPDLALFVNGLPLVVIELKNAADENATMKAAWQQLQTYKALIPGLLTYNALLVISDGLDAGAGSLSAGRNRFAPWKSADGKIEASHLQSRLEVLINGMLNKTTLLDLVRHFVVFEKTRKTDLTTGLVSISTAKKIAACHQYYAVNKAVESTLRAASADGNRKAGVVWHTQGSGKSLSMVFYTGKMVLQLDNPTVLVLTDRNDLDDQLFDTFAASSQVLRQEPKQAADRQHLKELLKVSGGGVVFSTMQKFQPESGNVYDELSARRNIVVIADEAHRTQYGFQAKTIDEKDASGAVIGKKTVYGFAKYLRDALPDATYLGFTGTPVEKTDVNTPAVFGDYVDVYDIAQAVEDGATVPIYYESRLAGIALSEEGKRLVAELDEELAGEALDESREAKAKRTRLEALVGSEQRLNNIARDIVEHFEARQAVFSGKGMIACMSRPIAAALYKAVIALRPGWHSDDLNRGALKVVMRAESSDGPDMAMHHTNATNRKTLAERVKNPRDELRLVIVCDMWLTGFDAPCLHTMYLDKRLRGHSLMQAIARVNRVYGDKPGGLIVDYLGIAADLKKALSFYSEAEGKGDPTLMQEQAVKVLHTKLETIAAMYHGFPYKKYFAADTAQKLSLILAAEDHILGLDDGKKRYIDEVAALSSAFVLAVPHEEALAVKDEVAFFQAVKARLAKFTGTDTGGGGRSPEDIELTIRQVIDKALVSEEIIDVFDAAGMKKSNISILSEEFMLEMKGMEHKNIAIEVLKKLLNDELKARSRTNLVRSKALLEMLEAAIRKYHNKILTAVEVIEEMLKLAKDVTASDDEAAALGLNAFEYAFYTAVANNRSARELMQKDKLRELAVVLTERVRKNATIDWTIKESVRANLRVIIKRTLRQFGYPPDMRLPATETVMKQAEMIAEELTDQAQKAE